MSKQRNTMEHYKIPKKSFDKITLCVAQLKQENLSTASDYWCNEIFRLLQTTEKPVLTPPANAIIHELKIHPTYFKETVEGTKNNEIRMAGGVKTGFSVV